MLQKSLLLNCFHNQTGGRISVAHCIQDRGKENDGE